MSRHSRHAGAAAVLIVLVAAGCGGDSPVGPRAGRPLDATRTAGDLSALNGALRQSALASVAALGERVAAVPVASTVVEAAGDLVAGDDAGTGPGRLAAVGAQRLIDAVRAEAMSPALPTAILGTTFVYDPAAHRYVPAPDRGGAPPNGIRYILYAVNPHTREPVASAEIGHADLTDEGVQRPSGVALRLVAVTGELTFLDYFVAVDGADGAGSLSVGGFVSDGATKLLFGIEARSVQRADGAQMDLAFQLAVPERDFAAAARVQGVRTETGSVTRTELTIHSAGTTIGLVARGDDRATEALVSVNGRPFAVIHGAAPRLEIRGADGRELGPEEVAMLHHIMGLAGSTFELFGSLLQPAVGILGGLH